VSLDWAEPREFAIYRAKLQNKIINNPASVAITAATLGAFPVVFIIIGSLIIKYPIYWDLTLTLGVFCSAVTAIGQIISNWQRPKIRSITIDSENVTLSAKNESRSVAIKELIGWCISKIEPGDLLVLGHPEGRNLAIGIPAQTIQTIRDELSKIIKELPEEEMPEPSNPYVMKMR
jgi:hypothetical protein